VTARAGKKTRTRPGDSRSGGDSPPGGGDAPAGRLRPRPRLFIGLLILLVLWVVILLVMYFTTVYPQRHGASRIGMAQVRQAWFTGLH
jgi:hypothetical protein